MSLASAPTSRGLRPLHNASTSITARCSWRLGTPKSWLVRKDRGRRRHHPRTALPTLGPSAWGPSVLSNRLLTIFFISITELIRPGNSARATAEQTTAIVCTALLMAGSAVATALWVSAFVAVFGGPGFGTMFGANWYVHRSGGPL